MIRAKLFPMILVGAFALTSTSCTPEQWRRVQEINTKLANYVNDAMLAVSVVRGFVESFVPASSRDTVSDVFDAINACNEALQAESAVVQRSNTPLDTPGQVASSFPNFISAWNHLMDALHAHNLNLGSAGAPRAVRPIQAPRLVRDAAGDR